MNSLGGRLRRIVFGISPDEATFERRGFRASNKHAQERFEQIGRTFIAGYLTALGHGQAAPTVLDLEDHPRELQGFAFEGAAMALALLDRALPWGGNRVEQLLSGQGEAHAYMVHVGVGWAMARWPFSFASQLERLDPLLRWLAFDGYGFHEGYFHWPRAVDERQVPRRLKGYALRAFDQGLGRSLFFVRGGDIHQISTTVATFSAPRRGDLWSGLGLAAVYAGGVTEQDVQSLVVAAGDHRPQLAQGAAFAAKARLRAGLETHHTESACRVICGLSAREAAVITDEALDELTAHGEMPAYELWRQRIEARFAGEPCR